jgi:MFS family permease
MERIRRVGPSLAGGLKRADAPVLGIRRFRLLWLAQIFAHTAQNATLFTLLVLVVAETGSTIQGSLLVLSYVLPSVLFGLVAGLLVDRWRKRTVLVITSVLRMGVCLAFVLVGSHVWLIYAINLGFSTLGQFFTTADAASIPALVPRNQLMAANSLFNLALTGSQFGGMVLLAPVLIKSFGSNALFIMAALFFLVATVLAYRLP